MAQAALRLFLEKREKGIYAAKLIELRESIEDWLSYTTQTFPHYTRHTVGHSEEIILQLSNILFEANKSGKPTFDLGCVEAYILCAAAYLHDAGMVCADEEKREIISSDAWGAWLQRSESARDSMAKIEALRTAPNLANAQQRNFAADLELRRLIADYVRRSHHERSADLVVLHQSALGRCGFDDPALTSAIATVCRGHGLTHEQLDDDSEFPTSTQIRGENVNLRLLAILFRLGDLLDVSHQRACSLLLNAANPIPADSSAHWDQYTAIRQKSFTTEEIRIVALCDTAEQQRVLADWCKWIVDEVGAAPSLLARSKLHRKWRPPHAKIGDGVSSTIVIKPSAKARYKPVKWEFEIATDQIVTRLTKDAYTSPLVFIRELIQNSLDATRCRMYSDHHDKGLSPNPALIPTDIREKYKIRMKIGEIYETNNEGEILPVLQMSISDNGTGMDEKIVVKNLLQIGRSYYQTEEFKKKYKFTPNSAFGVGFLSVFNVSDRVTVKTRHHLATLPSDSIKLTLTGPRSYIAVETEERDACGTTVEINFRQDVQLRPGQLTDYVAECCCAVEIPITVDDFGNETDIFPEAQAKPLFAIPDVEQEGTSYKLRHHERNSDHGKVEIYVLARVAPDGLEDWSRKGRYGYTYKKENPHAEYVELPKSRVSIGGIHTDNHPPFFRGTRAYSDPIIEQIDIRDRSFEPTLSRDSLRVRNFNNALIELRDGLWHDILVEHMSDNEAVIKLGGWEYIQRLADAYPFNEKFWLEQPCSVMWFDDGKPKLGSMSELLNAKKIHVALHKSDFRDSFYRRMDRNEIQEELERKQWLQGRHFSLPFHVMMGTWSDGAVTAFSKTFIPMEVSAIDDGWYLITYSRKDNHQSSILDLEARSSRVAWIRCRFTRLKSRSILAIEVGLTEYFLVAMNTPLDRMLVTLASPKLGFRSDLSANLLEHIRGAALYAHNKRELTAYIEKWNKVAGLPSDLQIVDVPEFVDSISPT